MKINPAAAYQAYNRISDHTHSPRRTGQYPEGGALKAGNTDQIQISHEGTRKMEAEQLSRSIMAEIREPASPERIEDLRRAVQSGSYRVPTGELVDAVIRHFVA
ncbi:MAG: flagellar biosynthesis anti-sigma factor FlgM [Angelakisella sp.]|jgi:anti-sigma28 factor (negative regulator of flagellin synthesis)|nr:flagellar biosynthesis anti-sigma factor FlgM [Angelakisella sp.]MCI9528901.1 flagellar biosynthesis anti-sigma factor FlgM [Angelakisella sp.]